MSPEARNEKNEYKRKNRAAMSPEAKAKANEYVKEWKRNHKDRVRQYNVNYWERKDSPLTRAMLQEQKEVDNMLLEQDARGSNKNADFMTGLITFNEN